MDRQRRKTHFGAAEDVVDDGPLRGVERGHLAKGWREGKGGRSEQPAVNVLFPVLFVGVIIQFDSLANFH